MPHPRVAAPLQVVAAAATPAVQGVSIYEDGIIPVEELWLKK